MNNKPIEQREDQQSIEQFIQERGKHYNKLSGEVGEILNELSRNVISEYRESVRNLAIISGALASFSMLALTSDFVKEPTLLVIGIILLLVNVPLSFSHLFETLTQDTKGIMMLRKQGFKPMSDKAEESIKFIRGEMSEAEWMRGEKNFLTEGYDKFKKTMSESRKKDVTYFDMVLLSVLALGTTFIIMSFVSSVIDIDICNIGQLCELNLLT